MKLTSYHCYTPWCWASSRARTYDRLITSELLYQLSYWSIYNCWGDRTRTCEVEWRLIYSQLSLPLENTPIKVEPCGFEPHSQDFQSCAYTMSAKVPSKSGSRRIRTSGSYWINTLAVCRFQPLTHTSFVWWCKGRGPFCSLFAYPKLFSSFLEKVWFSYVLCVSTPIFKQIYDYCITVIKQNL